MLSSRETDKKPSRQRSKSVKAPTTVAFTDMIVHSFKDKYFRDGISPVLADMFSPLIQETVYIAVTTAVTAAIEGIKTTVVNQTKTAKNRSQCKIK